MDWRQLAHRAVACKPWDYEPGMLALPDPVHFPLGLRIIDTSDPKEVLGFCLEDHELRRVSVSGLLPDLRDLPTQGALLSLVQDAWGNLARDHGRRWCSTLHVECRAQSVVMGEPLPSWRVVDDKTRGLGKDPRKRYHTPAEALVAALEASEGQA